MIPPPNVTGALHVGHAFNNTLQDILVRWHRMRGFDTLWQPGQDHAGIATQMQVEKMLAATQQPGRKDLGREKFLEKVWEWKGEYGRTIINQLKRLGSSCDWERNAFTMSGAPSAPAGEEGNFHDAVIKVFVEMYNKGLIYRGKRLVNWDPKFETAISDLEVENIEVDGHMWHFKYPLAGGATYTYVEKDEDGNVVLEEERDHISIATTRPETMLGDGAVAVHPSDERYAPIVGKLCEIPVGPKEQRRLIPIITDDYPDPDFGSGAVKITGAHDFNDHMVAKRNKIPQYRLMDVSGTMRADGAPYRDAAAQAQTYLDGADFSEAEIDAINLVPDDYRGLDRFDARKKVVADITAEGLVVMTLDDDPRLGKPVKKKKGGPGAKAGTAEARDAAPDTDPGPQPVPLIEAKKIMQPFGDRSNVVIEPMLTDQWFVAADKIVDDALDAVKSGEIKILPESGEKTYYHWLENIEPWCISRQLWWGHQIPVWYGPTLEAIEAYPKLKGGRQLFCAASETEVIEQARKYYGKEVQINFFPLGAQGEMTGFGFDAERLSDVSLSRDPDVLDTWFSSGLWPIGTLGWPEDTDEYNRFFPTDVLITGFDIIFFWVARMIMMQRAVVGQNPFHTVYLHQLVRDEKGKKMSKTTGNVIDPLEIIDEYGADALRFTNTSMAAIGGVLKLSRDRIAGYRNFGTKLWNAFSLAEHYEIPYFGQKDAPDAQLAVNKWIIGETAKIRETVDKTLSEYRFNDTASALYAFVWGKVCDWYLEFSKPILQGEDGAAKLETQQTLRWVLDQCLILQHPIMPFITEELWSLSGKRDDLLALTDWPDYTASDLVDAEAEAEISWVISLIEGVRSARAQMGVPASLHVPLVVTGMDDVTRTYWSNNEALIKRLPRIEALEEVDTFPKGCVTVPVGAASFGMPLAEIIDVGKEKARLEKSLGKLAKELGGMRGRLNNPKFVESAPEEVIVETKANLAAREEEETKLQQALDRILEIG